MKVSANDIEYTDADYRDAQWKGWLMGVSAETVIVVQYYEGKHQLKPEARARMAEEHRAAGWKFPARHDRELT